MTGEAAAERERKLGLLSGVAAYSLWGFMPVYIKSVRAAPILEVLCHRIVWALVLLLVLSWQQERLAAIGSVLRRGRIVAALAASATLLAVNWLVYIWAVVNGRVLEASLGYFINPLISVLLGVAVFGERLGGLVRAAVAIAAIGVLWLAIQVGQPPWVALTLAVSFGFYGLLRKLAPVGALTGLVVETAVLLPLAGGYLAWTLASGRAAFLGGRPSLDLLLLLGGPVTAVPLLCFAAAARRLPLSALGFLQYLSPTFQFLLAVFVYGEAFDRARLVSFAFIWTALALFAVHSARRGAPEPVTDV